MGSISHMKKRFSLDDIDQELIAQGLLTFLYVNNLLVQLMAELGLSLGECLVLMDLRNRKDELNLNQVKNNLMVFSCSSITKMVDKLVGNGLITRRVNPTSRRERLIQATPSGRKTVALIVEVAKRQDKQLTKSLSLQEKKLMIKWLNLILHNAMDVAKDKTECRT